MFSQSVNIKKVSFDKVAYASPEDKELIDKEFTEADGSNNLVRLLVLIMDLYNILGILQLLQKEYLKGINNINNCKKLAQALCEAFCPPLGTNPQKQYGFYGDKVAIASILQTNGTITFFLSLAPEKFSWLLKIVGFGGDRDLGLQLLEESLN